MVQLRRISVALVFGFVSGLICYGGALFLGLATSYNALQIINVFVNRMLIGFVIGVSALKMKWYLHGIEMGTIVGLPFLLHDAIAGIDIMVLAAVALLSAIFGLLIEFCTSKVFNAPIEGT